MEGKDKGCGDWVALALCQEAVGNRKQASKAWMSVLKRNPLAVEAVEGLGRVGASNADIQNYLSKVEASTPWVLPLFSGIAKAATLSTAGLHREAAQEYTALDCPNQAADQLLRAGETVPSHWALRSDVVSRVGYVVDLD
jgi:hypothetical protein